MRCVLAAALVAATSLPARATSPASPPTPTVFASAPFDEALRDSTRTGRVLVVMFSASWCGPCKSMEGGSWTDAAVGSWVRANGAALHLDWDRDGAVFRRYGVQSLPLLIAFRAGQPVDRSLGYKDAGQLRRWLEGLPQGPAPDAAPTAPTGPSAPASVPGPTPPAPGAGARTALAVAPPALPPAAIPPAPAPSPGARPGSPAEGVDAPAAPLSPERLVVRLRNRHRALSSAMAGKDRAAADAARVEFRATAARAFAEALRTGDDGARSVADEATRLDDSAWVRLAMVNKALETGRARPWMAELLDRAEALGADAGGARRNLDRAR